MVQYPILINKLYLVFNINDIATPYLYTLSLHDALPIFAIRYERREARNTVTRLYLTGTSNDYVHVPTRELVRFQVEELDLPEIPVPSLPPSDTLYEASSAASTRNKIPCAPAKQHIGRGTRRGARHT